jgi:hypothetical protein
MASPRRTRWSAVTWTCVTMPEMSGATAITSARTRASRVQGLYW